MIVHMDNYILNDSLVENINALRKRTSPERTGYFYEILGRSIFLGSMIARKESVEGNIDRYTEEEQNVNRIYEMLVISSVMRDAIQWLNTGMKIPDVHKKLEEKINVEITIARENGRKNRIYYLLRDKLKSNSYDYKKIAADIKRTLDDEEHTEEYKRFKEEYENMKDNPDKRRRLLANHLIFQEEIIRKALVGN